MQAKAGQLTIWGRANSVNVQKVLWCLAELDLAYERIDAGMAFGKNDQPEYLAMNPNGRVPTLVDGDYVLWESNSIMRYLNLAYGKGSAIYPQSPQARAAVDRWLDWTLSTLQPVDRPGVLVAGAHAEGEARHGRDPEGRRCRGRGVAHSRGAACHAAATSRAISSPSPTSRSAPLRAAGSASKA